MNRVVTAYCAGETIKKSSPNAGAAGSHDAVTLRFTFSPEWDGTTKKIIFIDSHGEKAVNRICTTDYLTEGTADSYDIPIPGEGLAYEGKMTITVRGVHLATDGVTADRIMMATSTTMDVSPAEIPTGDVSPVEPTATQAEQLQAEIAVGLVDIVAAEANRVLTENDRYMAESSRRTSEDNRWNAESERISKENARIINEGDTSSGRIKAEADRVEWEAARAIAESDRVSAEDYRDTAEGNRLEAESNRNSSETNRNSSEWQRAVAEESRVTAENSRVAAETTRNVFEAYSAVKAYALKNKVVYNGSSYLCIQATTAGTLPTNTSYWMLIASGGTGTSVITDYVKAGSKTALAATDTVNQAMGKLEAGVDGNTTSISELSTQKANQADLESAIMGTFGGVVTDAMMSSNAGAIKAVVAEHTTSIDNLDTKALALPRMKNRSNFYRRNYKSNSGVQLVKFYDTSVWSGAAISEDTVNVKLASKALKLSAGDGLTVSTDSTINKSLIGTNKKICLTFYLHNAVSDYSNILIYLTSSAFSKFFSHEFMNYTGAIKQGWNYVELTPNSEWTNTSAESWDNVFTTVRLKITSKAGFTTAITFDSITIDTIREPRVVIRFDDGYDNNYQYAFPIMKAKGFYGTTYCITSKIGVDSNFLTLAHAKEMYNNGWDIGNHSNTHAHFNAMTLAEIQADIQTAQAWLIDNGFVRTANHFAVPFGEDTANVQTALNNLGIITSANSDSTYAMFYPETLSLHQLSSYAVSNTTTLNTVIDKIESAINGSKSIILMFHSIKPVEAEEYDWSVDKFTALVNYLYNRGIAVVPMSEWHNGL